MVLTQMVPCRVRRKDVAVSNTAPYTHFKDKDEFIGAMQQHLLGLFAQTLEEIIGSIAIPYHTGKEAE